MFIKQLIISSHEKTIRNINFCSGLNLIIDKTPYNDLKSTGNNVGKTTVLKLIDFCLGAQSNIIYTDTESKKEVYDVVKDFLVNEEVMITLILTEDLTNPNAKQLKIQRNFLKRSKAIRKINGKDIQDQNFEKELEHYLMPEKKTDKPTFRQMISHNMRYTNESISNTLKTLNPYTSDIEYETLYLYLLGCTFKEGAKKQNLITKINQENTFKDRLEKKNKKTTYEFLLSMINDDINALNMKKDSFNLNKTLEQDLELLNETKYKINRISSQISKLKIRRNLINESLDELKQNISHIDLQQLKLLYDEVTLNISGIGKTFEDLVSYHNNMVNEKINYISQDLPKISQDLKDYHEELEILLEKEKELTNKVAKGDSFEELEKIISELNEKYRAKGEYESIISQVNEIEENIKSLNTQISTIDKYLFSDSFEVILKEQVKKFNKFFSRISQELYGEKYALTFEKRQKKGQKFYKFNAFNTNMSSGKKQGEILCFDLAYLLFADKEHIPCLHFLLNDKKELLHDHQLIEVAQFVQDKNIQLVISILKDKLPSEVLKESNIIIELSQKNKLFKIEK